MLNRIVARMRSALGARSAAHRSAHQYWKDCSCTFLAADPTYYDRQEAALRGLLQRIGPAPERGLDVGCGNGRFSIVLAGLVRQVTAFDLSQTLIQEARESARALQVENVEFQLRDLEMGFPPGLHDLVACMGVTSTLIDEAAFDALIRRLHDAVAPKGHLITKDSLSVEADVSLTTGEYITIYRSAERYQAQLANAGFRLIDTQVLAEWGTFVNKLFLWSKD